MKYIIQVHEIMQAADDKSTVTATQEIFKLGVDTFDPLTFVQALTATKRGRPAGAKKTAKEAA
jgi:hypothetical protein